MGRSGGGGSHRGGGSRGRGFSGGSRSSGGFSGRRSSGGGRSSSRSGGGLSFGGSSGSSRSYSSGGSHLPTFIPVPVSVRGGSGGGGCGRPSGCFSVIVALIALAIFMSLFGSCATGAVVGLGSLSSCAPAVVNTAGGGAISDSTVEREKLPASATVETGYYTDADGSWVNDPSKLQAGMRAFYKKTGVQPYLYILPNAQTTSIDELTALSEQYYSELFEDEGHFILVFCDDGYGSYNCGYTVGAQAKTVMDAEALDILADYLDRHYFNYSLTEEEIFSKTFEDTGERIMTVKGATARLVTKVLGVVTVVAIVAIVVIVVVKKRGDRLDAEARRQQEILNMPLEKFGDTELDRLERKYADDDSGK